MDDKDVEAIITVFNEKSVSRAAQKLYVSQPALTYRINKLEEQFNIKIFVKGKGVIKFTNQGELLVRHALEIKNLNLKFEDKIENLKSDVSGILRIGVCNNFATYKLPSILKSYNNIFPNVQFEVKTGFSINVMESLNKGGLHIGIIRGEYEWNGSKLLIGQDPLCLISKDPVVINDLPNLPRIRHKTDPDARRVTELWWNERFIQPPKIYMEVDKIETCKEMILNGLGYGFMTRYLLKSEETTDDLFIMPLKNLNGNLVLRNLWVFYNESDINLNCVKTFVNFLSKYVNKNKTS